MALATLEEIKNYLQINSTNEDARLANLVNYASSIVETYCNRNFEQANVTEYRDGGRNSVFVDRIPINSINVVAEYNGSSYVTLNGPNADGSLPDNVTSNSNALQYVWDSETGEITRLDYPQARLRSSVLGVPIFDNYPKGVKITYNGGYSTIPYDLKMAVLDYVKMLHKHEEISRNVAFQGEAKTTHPLAANFPAHIKRVLDLYRIIW